MIYTSIGNPDTRKKICERVKRVRLEKFGESRGAQKTMAKALGIPYTTYRGYEENRINDGFLRMMAQKFDIPLLWLMCADIAEKPIKKTQAANVFINPEKPSVDSSLYQIFRVIDDSMEPTIPRDSWIGYLPIAPDQELHGKIALLEQSGKTIIRRLKVQQHIMIGVADNPRLSDETIRVHKKEIIGQVLWQFRIF